MAQHEGLLQIHLLGGFSLTYDGEVLPPLASRHARLLFAWLALRAGRPQPRSRLADILWPDVPESRARRRLSHALWQIQDCFNEAAADQNYLLTPGDTVVFDADADHWLDVEEFERRMADVDRAGQVDTGGLRHLRRCAELYQGDLLAGSYEGWVLDEQDRLRQQYVSVLARLVEASKQRGNFEEALAVARRLTHQAPLQEEAHREVMRLCVLLGQPSQALEQFERCRSVLEEELGAPPSPATIELARQVGASRAAGGPTRGAAIDQLESERLVGRDEERVTLVDQLERTLSGVPGTVLLQGDAGVGKTQLLAQAAEDARWRGFTVLWGGASGSHVPYDAIRAALLPELTPVRVAQLHVHVDAVWLHEAGRLLPPLTLGAPPRAPGAGRRPVAGSDGADRMLEALARVIGGLAAIDPVALVIEDLHDADRETLALLRRLARTSGDGRLLVLASYRSVEARADENVWSTLRSLDRDARPLRLELAPLSAFEIGALLREVLGAPQVPASFTEAVHRESAGNPLYALELLRALRDTGTLHDGLREHLDTLTIPVTDGLRALIAERLRLLEPSAAKVAQMAAVLGAACAVDTLRDASPVEPRDLAVALGELAGRNLLVLDGDRARFTHAATQAVLLDELDADHGRQLRTVAADALERTHPDEVEALAALLHDADLPGRALPYLRRAATAARSVHAHGTAAHHLDRALACSERSPMATDDRRELLLEAETVYGVLGRRADQDRVLDELEALVGGAPEHRVELGCRRTLHLGLLDRFDEAVATAEATAGAVEAHPALHGRVLAALGQVLGWAGDNGRSAAVLSDAIGLLDDDDPVLVTAHFGLGTALRFLQRFEEAGAELRTAHTAAEAIGDEIGAVQSLEALATVHAETGATAEAASLYERAVAEARRIGFRHREGVGLVNLATVRGARTELAAALRSYDEALEVFTSLGNGRGVAMVQMNRGWIRHRWLGEDEAAREDVDAAAAFFRETGNLGQIATCLETTAAIARREGNRERAAADLADGLQAARDGHDRRSETQLLRSKAEFLLAVGDPSTALSVAEDGLSLASDLGLAEFAVELASLAAVAAIELGDVPGARGAAARAEEHLHEAAEAHRVHHRLAVVADRSDRPAAAANHHRTAAQLLEAALDGLPPAARDRAIDAVPLHRSIIEAAAAHVPRRIELAMASVDAPRGRALRDDELVRVTIELDPASPAPDARRAQLLDLLHQAAAQGAEATIDDLTAAFEVSASTVRRDLRTLRAQGHDATTRGTGTG